MAFSDQEIIEAIRQDKPLTRYMDQLRKNIYRSIRYYVFTNSGTEEDAEDLFQEAACAFVQMVRKGTFRGKSSITTLLFAIARRLWLFKLRTERRKHTVNENDRRDNQIAELEEIISEYEEIFGRKQAIKEVSVVIGQLGEGCKQVLTLFFFDRLSLEDIRDRLPAYKNIHVVKTKKCYCWKLFKKKLKNYLDDYKSDSSNY